MASFQVYSSTDCVLRGSCVVKWWQKHFLIPGMQVWLRISWFSDIFRCSSSSFDSFVFLPVISEDPPWNPFVWLLWPFCKRWFLCITLHQLASGFIYYQGFNFCLFSRWIKNLHISHHQYTGPRKGLNGWFVQLLSSTLEKNQLLLWIYNSSTLKVK